MYVVKDQIESWEFQIPVGLIRSTEDRFALRIYLSCLLYCEPIKGNLCSIKGIAEDAKLFPGKKLTKRTLEQVRNSLSQLEEKGYIRIFRSGTEPYDGNVKNVRLVYTPVEFDGWKSEDKKFVRLKVKECQRLLDLAAQIDIEKYGLTSLNVLRVYCMMKYLSQLQQKKQKDQIPVYAGAFSAVGEKEVLNLSNKSIMMAIDILNSTGAISAWKGIKIPPEIISKAGQVDGVGYQSISAAIFMWCIGGGKTSQQAEEEMKKRVNAAVDTFYHWTRRPIKTNKKQFKITPPLHARLLQG